ncbi:MAG: WD40/YVTN/BNR-like repeat-containing protein, partial [Chloroflexota bacterium]
MGSNLRANGGFRALSWYHCLGRMSAPPTLGLTALSFSDAAHGWASGISLTRTYLLRTANGGKSWRRLDAPAAMLSLDFINPHDGWAEGLTPAGCFWFSSPTLPCRQVVLATNDGGMSWRQELSWRSNILPFQAPKALQFLDRRHGWLIPGGPDSRLLATTNGGMTWHQMFTSVLQLTGLHFVDLRHGWIAGSRSLYAGSGCNTRVFATEDGGRRWMPQLHRLFQCSPTIDFVNLRDGWVLSEPDVNRYCEMGGCNGSFLSRTTDGGRHWTKHGRVAGGGTGLSGFEAGVVFVTPEVGWIPSFGGAGGGDGGINVTHNGGRTWTRFLRRYDVAGPATVALPNVRDGR